MARPSRASTKKNPRAPRDRTSRASPADPFHIVTPSIVERDGKTRRVPTLILRGEWLKAAGFPIGSDAYVIVDRNGELALHRSGLRFPRKVRVMARR